MKTLSGISQILFNRFYCIFRTLPCVFCTLAIASSVSAQETDNAMLKLRFEFPQDSLRAHTLEVNEEEKLVVTSTKWIAPLLWSMCLPGTFSRQEWHDRQCDYARTLQSIRYRDGKINGYTSRLHYIADWVNNGVRHGFMEDVTAANSPIR